MGSGPKTPRKTINQINQIKSINYNVQTSSFKYLFGNAKRSEAFPCLNQNPGTGYGVFWTFLSGFKPIKRCR